MLVYLAAVIQNQKSKHGSEGNGNFSLLRFSVMVTLDPIADLAVDGGELHPLTVMLIYVYHHEAPSHLRPASAMPRHDLLSNVESYINIY